MESKQEHIELIENIVKTSPGFRGNEDLLDEMVSETLKKAQSFLEGSLEVSSLEIYIKKIAMNVIVDTVKNAETIRAAKSKKIQINVEFEEIPILYETDKEGKIAYNFEIPKTAGSKETKISEEKINNIKEKILELDKENSLKNYKEIFELRFIKEMNCREIAQKLEMEENEVSTTLLELLREIDSV